MNVDVSAKDDIKRVAAALESANQRRDSMLALIIGFIAATLLSAGVAHDLPHVTAGGVAHIAAIVYSICAMPTLLLFFMLRMGTSKITDAEHAMLYRFQDEIDRARRHDKQLALLKEIEDCQAVPAPLSPQLVQKLAEARTLALVDFNLARNAFLEYDRPIRLAAATAKLARLAALQGT